MPLVPVSLKEHSGPNQIVFRHLWLLLLQLRESGDHLPGSLARKDQSLLPQERSTIGLTQIIGPTYLEHHALVPLIPLRFLCAPHHQVTFPFDPQSWREADEG